MFFFTQQTGRDGFSGSRKLCVTTLTIIHIHENDDLSRSALAHEKLLESIYIRKEECSFQKVSTRTHTTYIKEISGTSRNIQKI
jgi:hypothetical protein